MLLVTCREIEGGGSGEPPRSSNPDVVRWEDEGGRPLENGARGRDKVDSGSAARVVPATSLYLAGQQLANRHHHIISISPGIRVIKPHSNQRWGEREL